MDHGQLSEIVASAREVEVLPPRMPDWVADHIRELNEHAIRRPGFDPLGYHRAAASRFGGQVLACQLGPMVLIRE